MLAGVAAAACFVGLASWQAWSDSATFDEPVYVSAGLVAVSHHDLWLNAEHPPLAKVLAALPVWAAGPVVPAPPDRPLAPRAAAAAERSYSSTWLRAQGGRLHLEVFLARLVPELEAVLTAVVLFLLGRRLLGPAAGLVAGALWLSSPLVLGLGHLDGVNLPEALATVATAWAVTRWLDRRTAAGAVLVGALAGLAASGEATGALVAALAALTLGGAELMSGAGLLRAAARTATVAAVAWAVLWAGYLVLDPAVLWQHPAPVPEPWLSGVRFLSTNETVAAPGFLLGRAWTGGRWWFWPGSVVVKTAWPALALLVAGPVALAVRRRRLGGGAGRAAAVLAPPGLALAAAAVRMPRDLGIRYLLPVLALWMVAAGGVVAGAAGEGAAATATATAPATSRLLRPVLRPLLRGRRGTPSFRNHSERSAPAPATGGDFGTTWSRSGLGRSVLAAGACALSAVAGVWSAPHSLAWTNPPFRPGYRVATDSNLDWGQDLHRLVAWSAGRRPRVAYFGPRGAGVPGARPLVGVAPARVTGWVAVSASALTSAQRDALGWLRAYCPVGTLSGTILLYRFDAPPTAGRPAGAAPPPVCAGRFSRPA